MAARQRPGSDRVRPGKKRNSLWDQLTIQDGQDHVGGPWICKFCEQQKSGSLRRLIAHVARVPGEEIDLCNESPPDVIEEMRQKFFLDYAKAEAPEWNGPPVFSANAKYTNVNGEIVKASVRGRNSRPGPAHSSGFSASNDDHAADAHNVDSVHGAGSSALNPNLSGVAISSGGLGVGGMQLGLHSTKSTSMAGRAPGSLAAVWQNRAFADADVAVRRFVYATAQPFNLMNNPYWKEMVLAVGRAGPGYASVSPKYEAIRVRHLNEEYESLQSRLQVVREGWKKYGVTIVTDSWPCSRKRSIVNFLAVSVHGSVFLRSFDALEEKKTGAWLWSKLRPILLEVGVENIVQLVTDNGSNFVLMGELMRLEFPSIVHGRCVCHCLNLLLKDISELDWVKPSISDCSKIVSFMLKKPSLVAAFRKTAPRDLIKPAATRFAYNFLVMSELVEPDMRRALEQFVTSDIWYTNWESNPEAQQVKEIIQRRDLWEDCLEVLLVMEPVLKVLKLADREGATMGLIFEIMDRAQESLSSLADQHVVYPDKVLAVKHFIFELSEEELGPANEHLVSKGRWKMMHTVLQGVGHCLNPLWLELDEDEEAVSDLHDYFELVSGAENEAAIVKLTRQYRQFRQCAPKEMARRIARSREMRLRPVEWWLEYGHALPELQKVALRVLSQTISASSAERNWSIWSIVQSKRRARLLSKTMEKLVFCYSNLKLLKAMESREMVMLEVDADKVNVEAQWLRALVLQESWEQMEVELHDASNVEEVEEGAHGDLSDSE